MEKVTVHKKIVQDEQNQVYELQYSILISLGEDREIYGIEIQKTDKIGTVEVDFLHGISECRKEIEDFIYKLWKATALPVELAVLCDDFISEKERTETEKNIWAAC